MEVGQRRRRTGGAPFNLAGLVAILLCAWSASAVAAPEPQGQEQPALEWEATINERPVAEIDANDPVRLNPEEGAYVGLVLTNPSTQEVAIRSVRLDGSVMGLTMYNFTTRIDLVMPPDSITTRRIDVDLIDLSGQATGLIPSRLQLLDNEREVLVSESFPADIRGSLASIYGVFALGVLGITLVLLASLLLAIRRSQLPENRWQRAMRFVPVGVGLGFILTFTLSATRQLSPNAASWTTVVLLCAGAALAVGYFLPLGVAGEDEADELGYAEVAPEDDTAQMEPVGAEAASTDDTWQTTTDEGAGHFWSSGPDSGDQGRATPEDSW
jgi:hypothetical protein